MKWLTLDRIKAQCRIEQDFHDEDGYLADCGEEAEEVVLNYCGRPYEEIHELYGGVPAPMRKASLLLVDLFYQRRSPADAQNLSIVPYGNIDMLLKPYMRLTSSSYAQNQNQYGCKHL